MPKTVYILGAGFSYPAKLPIQSQILESILDYKPEIGELDLIYAQEALKSFVQKYFGNPYKISLEDIFTLLDRSVTGKERFKNYKWQALFDLRERLIYLILATINNQITNIPKKVNPVYQKFAYYLIQQCLKAGQKSDEVSIISLNWDTLLEHFINESIKVHRLSKKVKIDYCVYNHNLKNKGIPHINLKALGIHNIKVLKLHGSLNWLYCSNCGRLYVENENIGIDKEECKFCKDLILEEDFRGNDLPLLEPLIITPTLLKEYTNLHLKNIWQNAIIELQEASEIIFIGYSLPLADYEFKYILKKGIKADTQIKVILADSDKKNGTRKRFESFFKEKIEFDFFGLEKWAKSLKL